jgi:hypothetical protein
MSGIQLVLAENMSLCYDTELVGKYPKYVSKYSKYVTCRNCCKGGLVAPSLRLPVLQRRCRQWPWTIVIVVPPNDEVDPSSI